MSDPATRRLKERPARLRWAVVGAVALALAAAPALAFRHEQYIAKAARGRLMKVVAATFFGGEGEEEFVAAGSLPDGTIVAFGNAWGPTLPEPVKPTVLGRGEWYDVVEFPGGHPTDELGKPLEPAADFPNIAGIVVQYAPDVQSVRRILRFDWGLATITCGVVAPDGDLIIAGRGTHHLRGLAEQADLLKVVPAGADRRAFGPIYYQGVKMPGDVYVAKLAPDGSRLRWVWLFEGHRTPPRKMWPDKTGGVTLVVAGEITRISLDGRDMRQYARARSEGRVKLLAVSPFDGGYVVGGDRHYGTGREPWRKPEFFGFDGEGKLLWKIWDWTGPLVGHDLFRLVSDSAVRHASYDPETGEILVAGWSDGGNSVFTRQPIDLEESAGPSAYGMSAWGAQGALSFAYLLRLDPERLRTVSWTLWAAYKPKTLGIGNPAFTGDPNSAWIDDFVAGPGGAVGFYGRASTGLVQTPGAFYQYPYDAGYAYKYGGWYVAVFNREFDNLCFSSYMPGCRVAGIGTTPRGFVFAGRSVGDDREQGAGGLRPGEAGRVTPSPAARALQPAPGGGRYDAHLVVVEYP